MGKYGFLYGFQMIYRFVDIRIFNFWKNGFLPLLSGNTGPEAKNYEPVFLTGVRSNSAFDRRATETRFWSFWQSCEYFPISVLLTNGATNGGEGGLKEKLNQFFNF